jgi:hypothetical protein
MVCGYREASWHLQKEAALTRMKAVSRGRLGRPLEIASVPFVDTVDVDSAGLDPDEPSPCIPTAACVWYRLDAPSGGRLLIDLAGSTPRDPLVRLFREIRGSRAVFLGCASPVWNGQLVLASDVGSDMTYAIQVGTSESRSGRIVLRVELQERPLVA